MNNLGYLTDSFFLEDAREIIAYDDYTFVRSPNQPDFYFGNFLLLNSPPKGADKEKLERTFKKHFTDEQVKHFTFCWSGEKKEDIAVFLEAGYELDEVFVLAGKSADLIPLEEKNEEVNIRAFESEEDWEKWKALEFLELPSGFSEAGYKNFIEGRAEVYQKLYQKGQGNFYGAYIEDKLIASAGLFHQKNIGRFQSVKTHKDYRRKGICKTLVFYICEVGFQQLDTLVIAADKGYHALEIYKKLGFKEMESQTSVYWHEKV